jgi:maltooligosyltrehalose trehalohydrolase
LSQSYSNCTWQNLTLDAAKAVPGGGNDTITQLGLRLGLDGFPSSAVLNGETLPKTALQYIENHDHERFICQFGLERQNEGLFQNGNRDRWFKVQPYLIGLLMAKGIPMLWQGQEFCENYWLPPGGLGRVLLLRPVRWDYFYDEIGKSTVWLTRRLLHLRRNNEELRVGEHFFYNDPIRYQSRGLLLFSRYVEKKFSLVVLNFSDVEQTIPFWFPLPGNYVEQLDNRPEDLLKNVTVLTQISLKIPSNYGRVWRLEG